jgi:putative transcriptional regulator
MTTEITHHVSEQMLRDYAAGALTHPFAVAVASHLSLCDDCRAFVEAEELLAGAALSGLSPVPMGEGARERLLARLETAVETPAREQPAASGIFPSAVMAELGGNPPAWRSLGGGIRQQILFRDSASSLRLLYIPPGVAVPEHGHGGSELTLVLQGSFRDSEGTFGVGDIEVASSELQHVPVAGPDGPCICLAATDAPLRFRSLVPRLLQPLFRI